MTEARDLRMRAQHLLAENRVQDAIDAHIQLLDADASQPDDWFNLGYLQRCGRQFEQALTSYAAALARGIRGPEEVRVNRAAILSEHLGRFGEAEAELRQATKLNPEFLPAWLNLANLYEDMGQLNNAVQTYEHVLRFAPFESRALARLGAMDVHKHGSSSMIERLREALANQHSPAGTAEIGFALAQALDANGNYEEAFDVCARANKNRIAGIPLYKRYNRDAHEKLIDDLIATFSAAEKSAAVDNMRCPLFICGMFRSGSTLAEQILGRHNRVTAGGELELIPALVNNALQPYPTAYAGLDSENLAAMRDSCLQELDLLFPDRDLLTDKRCDNFLHIGFIKKLFPNAKFVHTKRLMIDNILSVFFLDFDDNISYGFDFDDIKHWYDQYLRLMAHWQSIYDKDIFDLSYDELVIDPSKTLTELLEFCDLDWDEACLMPGKNTGAIQTPSAWQARRPIHARSSGRWRNYEQKLSARLGSGFKAF
jgi:Sulfotransferase family/Tetratricopeptide repeat